MSINISAIISTTIPEGLHNFPASWSISPTSSLPPTPARSPTPSSNYTTPPRTPTPRPPSHNLSESPFTLADPARLPSKKLTPRPSSHTPCQRASDIQVNMAAQGVLAANNTPQSTSSNFTTPSRIPAPRPQSHHLSISPFTLAPPARLPSKKITPSPSSHDPCQRGNDTQVSMAAQGVLAAISTSRSPSSNFTTPSRLSAPRPQSHHLSVSPFTLASPAWLLSKRLTPSPSSHAPLLMATDIQVNMAAQDILTANSTPQSTSTSTTRSQQIHKKITRLLLDLETIDSPNPYSFYRSLQPRINNNYFSDADGNRLSAPLAQKLNMHLYLSPCNRPLTPADECWRALHLAPLQKYILPSPTSERWARLLLTWHEQNKQGTILKHTYAAAIDRKAWNFYLDDKPAKIYAKCLAQLILRPIHTALKTIYHLSVVAPLLYEISQTRHRRQSKQDGLKNMLKSLADIVRTPLYGLAIKITSAAILMLGPFLPDGMYAGRALLGKIEQMANWGKKHASWTMAGCFQPFDMSALEAYQFDDCKKDTLYYSDDPLERQLTNFGRRLIHYRRHNFDIFSCFRLKDDEAYLSPILAGQPSLLPSPQPLHSLHRSML